jgi:hypothetical protein
MKQLGQTPSAKAWRRYCEDGTRTVLWPLPEKRSAPLSALFSPLRVSLPRSRLHAVKPAPWPRRRPRT